MRRPKCILCFLSCLYMSVCPLQGAFIDGVETFTGTVKDTTHWEEVGNPIPSRVTQNDNITLGFYGVTYRTRYVTVGLGQSVSVQLMNIQESSDPPTIQFQKRFQDQAGKQLSQSKFVETEPMGVGRQDSLGGGIGHDQHLPWRFGGCAHSRLYTAIERRGCKKM